VRAPTCMRLHGHQALCACEFQTHHQKAQEYSCLLHVSPPESIQCAQSYGRSSEGTFKQRSWARRPGEDRSSHTQPLGVRAACVGPIRIQMTLNALGRGPSAAAWPLTTHSRVGSHRRPMQPLRSMSALLRAGTLSLTTIHSYMKARMCCGGLCRDSGVPHFSLPHADPPPAPPAATRTPETRAASGWGYG
jgi:hypothetical protein